MNCRNARDLMTAAGSTTGEPAVEAHLRECGDCAAFSERLRLAAVLLGERRLELEPDAGFAARVLAALPEPTEMLGWAALRVLPATLALALVLVGWSLWQTQAPSSLVEESPSDDLLTWVMESDEVKP